MKNKEKECVFCSIVKGRLTSNLIMENNSVIAFFDINPLSDGHALIITKKHYDNLLEIEQKDWNDILPVLLQTARNLSNEYSLKGFNLISNIGEEAFQTVKHLHIHLIPKYKKKEGFVWPEGK